MKLYENKLAIHMLNLFVPFANYSCLEGQTKNHNLPTQKVNYFHKFHLHDSA